MCEEQEITKSHMKTILGSFNSNTKELPATNQHMQTYIDSCKKERADYPENNTLYLEKNAKITINSGSITP